MLRRPIESALGPSIAVVHQALPAPAGSRAQQCVLESEQGQPRGVEAGRDGPPHDPAGEHVGDERDVAEPCQRAHVGDVSDPQLMWEFGLESAFHEVWAVIRLTGRTRGDRLTAASDALQASELHQAGDLVPADLPPGAVHRVVHLPHPVHGVVLRVDSRELLEKEFVSQSPCGGWPALGSAVAAGGDEPTIRRAEHAADGLDPETIAVFVDERDHLVVGRSSSAAKNADAVFKISLARRSSLFSLFNLRISTDSSVVTPGR